MKLLTYGAAQVAAGIAARVIDAPAGDPEGTLGVAHDDDGVARHAIAIAKKIIEEAGEDEDSDERLLMPGEVR